MATVQPSAGRSPALVLGTILKYSVSISYGYPPAQLHLLEPSLRTLES